MNSTEAYSKVIAELVVKLNSISKPCLVTDMDNTNVVVCYNQTEKNGGGSGGDHFQAFVMIYITDDNLRPFKDASIVGEGSTHLTAVIDLYITLKRNVEDFEKVINWHNKAEKEYDSATAEKNRYQAMF